MIFTLVKLLQSAASYKEREVLSAHLLSQVRAEIATGVRYPSSRLERSGMLYCIIVGSLHYTDYAAGGSTLIINNGGYSLHLTKS